MKQPTTSGPGPCAPVRSFFRAILGGALLLAAVPGHAQPASGAAAVAPLSARPVPGDLELAKLIWSTMAMVDHANRSGNYSVLRDNGATGFQVNNNAAQLAQIFTSLRASRTDLSDTLLLAPTYRGAPALVQADVFRVRGIFGLRPTAIAFDLYFQWEQGRWRLFGVSISPEPLATIQPGPVGQAAPVPSARPRKP